MKNKIKHTTMLDLLAAANLLVTQNTIINSVNIQTSEYVTCGTQFIKITQGKNSVNWTFIIDVTIEFRKKGIVVIATTDYENYSHEDYHIFKELIRGNSVEDFINLVNKLYKREYANYIMNTMKLPRKLPI